MPIQIEPFSDLIFVHMPGCAACEEAMPELDKFAAHHFDMLILKIRADGPLVARLIGKKIRATPTYVLRRAGKGFTHEGAMSAKELGQWIDALTQREEGDA